MSATTRTLEPGGLDVFRLLGERVRHAGHIWFDDGLDYDLNVVSLRNACNEAGPWDDRIVVCWKVKKVAYWRVMEATTDPGRAALIHPRREDGTAILCPGQTRRSHALGRHARGKPTERDALVQVRPVRVWRDRTHDGHIDRTGPVFEGLFGINIHDDIGHEAIVQHASEGCQVLRWTTDSEELLTLVRKQGDNRLGLAISYALLQLADDPYLLPLFQVTP